jgi:flavorubredoxin
MTPLDYDSPIPIAPGTFWVSPRPEGRILYCNSYLLRLEGNGKKVHLLIDPGGTAQFNSVSAKVLSLIGDFKYLGAISVNHQDPDVVGSLPMLMNRLAPHANVLMTEDTWRLVAMTGIPKERVHFVEKFRGAVRFPAVDRTLEIILSPYCHFTGAFLIYDRQSGCLFTGDLFAGVAMDDGMYPLYATDHNWAGIRFFHERYMPCNVALRWIVGKIRQLEGLKQICPQHGSIIPEELIPEFLDRLENLRVGADLLADRELDDSAREAWNELANRVLRIAGELLGEGATARVADNSDLMDMGHFDGRRLVIDKLHQHFAETLVLALTAREVPEIANRIIMAAMLEAENLGLGAFAVDLAIEEPSPSLGGPAPGSAAVLEIEAG